MIYWFILRIYTGFWSIFTPITQLHGKKQHLGTCNIAHGCWSGAEGSVCTFLGPCTLPRASKDASPDDLCVLRSPGKTLTKWGYHFAQTHFNKLLLFTSQLPFYDHDWVTIKRHTTVPVQCQIMPKSNSPGCLLPGYSVTLFFMSRCLASGTNSFSLVINTTRRPRRTDTLESSAGPRVVFL